MPATGIAIVKNLAKLVLQKISLYRETVVVVTRSRDKLDRPPPPLSQLYREIPVSASYRIFHGATGNEVNEGWTEAALTEGIRGIGLARTDLSTGLVAREVAVTAWKLQLHRETYLPPAFYLVHRPHPFTHRCTLSSSSQFYIQYLRIPSNLLIELSS